MHTIAVKEQYIYDETQWFLRYGKIANDNLDNSDRRYQD